MPKNWHSNLEPLPKVLKFKEKYSKIHKKDEEKKNEINFMECKWNKSMC